MFNSEINPTRCNNCVYSSQWLYSTCFRWQFHPSSGVHMLYMTSGRQVYLCCNFVSIMVVFFGLSRFCLQILLCQMAAFVLYSFLLVFLYWYASFACWASMIYFTMVEASWNVMAHAQKQDFIFRQNGRVHLNWRERQFSRLLAAEMCASAVVMLDTPCSEIMWMLHTGYPLHSPVSPSLPLPCVTVCHYISAGVYIAAIK